MTCYGKKTVVYRVPFLPSLHLQPKTSGKMQNGGMCLCRINKQVDLGYCVYAEYFGSSWQCSLKLLKPVYSLLLDFTVSLGFYGLSSGHVWMWELDYNESWASKNWCFWTVVLEKTLESPVDCKEIQPVHPKWDQSWVFIGRIDAEAETPILWSPNVKSWLIGKDRDARKDGRQEEKGMTEDEMVGWHHRLNGHEFE